MELPGPDQIRSGIATLDATEKKVLGAMIVVMIKNHAKIKNQEWIAENFTRASVAALGFDEISEVDAEVRKVEAFVTNSMGPVLNLAYPLFAQVASDMQNASGSASFTLEAACTRALSYFAS